MICREDTPGKWSREGGNDSMNEKSFSERWPEIRIASIVREIAKDFFLKRFLSVSRSHDDVKGSEDIKRHNRPSRRYGILLRIVLFYVD